MEILTAEQEEQMAEYTANAKNGLLQLIRDANTPAKLKEDAAAKLIHYIRFLDEDDMEWAALRFGLVDGHPWNHAELAAEMNVPLEVVAETEKRILETMSERKKGFLWPTP